MNDLLPLEVIECILGQLDDVVDRMVAYCTCRLWRQCLAQVRRYARVIVNNDFWSIATRATAEGRWHQIRWFLDGRSMTIEQSGRLLAAATYDGQDAVIWMRERGFRWTLSTAPNAIDRRCMYVIDQVECDGWLTHPEIMRPLVSINDVDTLERVIPPSTASLDPPSSALRITIHAAVSHACIPTLRWLYRCHKSPLIQIGLCSVRTITNKGHPRTLEWILDETDIHVDCRLAYEALEGERIDIVMAFWRHYKKTTSRPGTIESTGGVDAFMILYVAIRLGRVDIAKEVVNERIVRYRMDNDGRACRGIVWSGCAKGSDYDAAEIICLLEPFAKAGMLVLNQTAYRDAAQRNQPTLLRWLHVHNCPMPDAHLGMWSLESGHADVVAWAMSVGVPLPADPIRVAIRPRPNDADGADRHVVVTLLTQHGHSWSAGACEDAARCGMKPTLALGVDRLVDGWDAEKCLLLALSVDSPRHRQTAVWIAQHVGIDLVSFERRMVQSALAARAPSRQLA